MPTATERGRAHPAGAPLKRKIAAILAADVAGYSRLVAEDEERTLHDLAAAREIFDGHVREGRGRIFNTAGDSVMCEFDSAVEAVRVALDIQESLGARNEPVAEDRRLAFRIGITIGDVVERGGDLLGDGVNIAARLEALAPPGGICISRSVHEAVANKIAVAFDDIGPRQVKNIPQPVHAFLVARPGEIVAPAGPAAGGARRPTAGPDQPRSRRRGRWTVAAAVAAVLGGASAAAWPNLVAMFGGNATQGGAKPPSNLAAAPPAETAGPRSTPAAKPEKPAVRAASPERPAAKPVADRKPAATAQNPADVPAAFAGLASQGLVADAKTLAELYHNARLLESKGDRTAALRAYAAAAPLAGDFVDPVLRYAGLLREAGSDAARRAFDAVAKTPGARGAALAAASLGAPADLQARLEAFEADDPDYPPADKLLADSYLARAGGPTLTERRLAFDALDRLVEAEARLPAFIVDRTIADEWIRAARARRGEIEAFFTGAASRPRAAFARTEAGWTVRVRLPEPAASTEVRVGEQGEIAPPAEGGVRAEGPRSDISVALPAATPRTILYVGYTDLSGREAGPFPIAFDPAAAQIASNRETLERFPETWVSFRTDLPDLLSYAQLATNRCAIASALIGFNDDPPKEPLPLPGCDVAGAASAPDIRSVIRLPAGTESVQVQIAYADGTESQVRTFRRP